MFFYDEYIFTCILMNNIIIYKYIKYQCKNKTKTKP